MKTKKNLILIGGGGHAKACIDVVQSSQEYNIIGYIDMKETIDIKYKIPYLGDDTCIKKYLNEASFIITVGQIKSASIRIKLFDYLKSINADIATIVSKNAIVSSHASIGKGSIIMHSVIVQSDVSIGENCIVNDRALLEHDVLVGNHCHISTGAILNGNVTVGSSSFIGSGAVVKNGITIGDSVVIGFASAIKNDIGNNQSWVGNPAKQIN
jgi:sugar O-acyltransferase (sialic acid O-acetyltransferase NeuD family)